MNIMTRVVLVIEEGDDWWDKMQLTRKSMAVFKLCPWPFMWLDYWKEWQMLNSQWKADNKRTCYGILAHRVGTGGPKGNRNLDTGFTLARFDNQGFLDLSPPSTSSWPLPVATVLHRRLHRHPSRAETKSAAGISEGQARNLISSALV